MRFHIHWFRKVPYQESDEIFRFSFKQCRCGVIKITDVKKLYVKSLERLTGIPVDRLTGLEVGRITGAERREHGDEL